MNSIKNVALASLAVAKDAATPEHIRGGLAAAAGKVGDLAGAAPAVVGKACCRHARAYVPYATRADQYSL